MKWAKVFSVFVLIHLMLWGGAHLYRSSNPIQVLIGVDTSFSLTASRQSIFRTAFGRSDADDFQRYRSMAADKRILLSDGSFVMQGWELMLFD